MKRLRNLFKRNGDIKSGVEECPKCEGLGCPSRREGGGESCKNRAEHREVLNPR